MSDIKGTTRDVIEDTITLGGTLFRFIDTAGIRQSTDVIENMGIERSFKKLDEAQLVLWVVDPGEKIDEIATFSQQILPRCHGKKVLAVVNKIDASSAEALAAVGSAVEAQAAAEGVEMRVAQVSARDGQGMDALVSTIVEMAALPSVADDEAVIVTNARHYQALVRAGEAISRSIDGLRCGVSPDFVSQDIRECMHYLGEITGEITTDDILGEIFSHFCVGK